MASLPDAAGGEGHEGLGQLVECVTHVDGSAQGTTFHEIRNHADAHHLGMHALHEVDETLHAAGRDRTHLIDNPAGP